MHGSPPNSPRGGAHGARLVVLALVSFTLTTLLLRSVLPGGEGDLLHAKLEEFRARDAADPIEAVFLGSSRIYHGVSPAVFDARMAELGHEVDSYNLAITGQKVDGAYGTLRSLAAVRPRGLRWVFVDVEDPSLMLNRQERTMRGVVYLHDPASTRLLLDYVWSSDLAREEKLERTTELLRACAYDAGNVGRALPWLDPLLGRAAAEDDLDFRIGPHDDGWRSKDDRPKPGSAAAHRYFLDHPEVWRGQIAELAATPLDAEPLAEAARPLIERIVTLVRELGAEPVFVISPSTALQGAVIDAAERGIVPTLLRFNDPEAYPELYATEARWEAAHLSAEGARRFSRRLAERFAEHLRETSR